MEEAIARWPGTSHRRINGRVAPDLAYGPGPGAMYVCRNTFDTSA
jgi:hypothetical protein